MRRTASQVEGAAAAAAAAAAAGRRGGKGRAEGGLVPGGAGRVRCAGEQGDAPLRAPHPGA
jgi:hypothetical protein